MAKDITINRSAWKLFKLALDDAIDAAGDDEAFSVIRSMLVEIDDENAKGVEPEAAHAD